MHLEQDDLGHTSDVLQHGQDVAVVKGNEERVALRGVASLPRKEAAGRFPRRSARVEVAGVPRILVVDEPQILRALGRSLDARGYETVLASTGELALTLAARHLPDLVILELGLPGIDGIEVIRSLREWTQVPIVVLSPSLEERVKITALDAGADDYVTKPFGIEELLARLRAKLRRRLRLSDPVVVVGELEVDLARRSVCVRDEPVQLTPREYAVLSVFARNIGRLLTHRSILREVWGPAYGSESHYLHVYISQLRRKIELDPTRPRYLLTAPSAGYRLVEPA